MNEEVMKVLNMLQEGKIDSQKAGELIDVLYTSKDNIPAAVNLDKMLKVRVNTQNGDNVNINIPVKFIRTIGGAIKRIPKLEGLEGMEDIDIQAILEAVSDGLDGEIVNVESENGDRVSIVVE